MINTNELRLGNLFNYEQTTHKVTLIREGYFKSKWLKDDKFEYTHIQRNGEYICASYLKLTHEQLLKVGFEKFNMAYVKGSFVINKWSEGELMYNFGVGGNLQLKYVHELQNLYYSLTKEELVYETKN
jgi:hypothetical protein